MQPIYLDNNATTPLDPRVFAAMVPVLEKHFGNPASTTHSYGWYAAELVKIAREQVAALLSAAPGEIVFTSGATESNNTVLFGLRNAGRIVSAATEHKATLDPLAVLKSRGRDITILPVRRDGSIDLGELDAACVPGTALVSLMLANNEIGTIHPVQEIAKLLRTKKILFHCDAAQAGGKLPLDPGSLGADFVSLSAHKMYGPKGIGVLYVRGACRDMLEPLLFGGGHEGELRSGTLNVPAIVGFGKAAEIAVAELDKDGTRLRTLSETLWRLLKEAHPDLRLNGPELGLGRLPGNLNFIVQGVENARLVGLVQSKVALSVSSACQSASKVPSHVLNAIGLEPAAQRQSVRLGIGKFNTEAEIHAAAVAISSAIKAGR